MGASRSSDPNQDGSDEQQKRSEIYTYEAPWHIYAMNWSVRRDKKYRLAIASLREQYPNQVEIVQLDDSNGEIRSDPNLSFEHPYPPTKTIFIPDKECQKPDLLATSSDFLRVWRISGEDEESDSSSSSSVELKSLLNGNKSSEFCGPLTSFDWNEAEPKRIGTSSIDTTCTIWDIEREAVDTQLIAHDKEVYDIAWGGVGVFASVSADGSVRVFDLRDKEHSTIIYESSEPDTPLVRLGWNKQDPRYMATIIMDSAKVVVLDIRFPTLPVVELQRHQASVNAIAWAPHSSCHICTAGDDSQALIWDLSSMGQPVEGGLDPILAYTAGAEIEQLQWSSSQPDWVAIAFSTKLQILRANGKGFAEFSGLRTSSACLPFGRKTSDDLFSVISFQTSAVGSSGGYKKGIAEAKLKVAINGFGRIGRNFLRCWHGRKDSPLDVVVINDTGGVKQASHLLKYDSTLGIFDADVKPAGDNGISVDGKVIKVVSSRNPLDLPWKDLEIDLVIEGTGVFVDREGAGKHLQAGAKKVLITAPGKGDIPTYVVGVNADAYSPDETIISNASCTTNCLAPFVKVLDQKFGIIKGTMTTTHSYTGDQRLLDASHRDLRRARAAALNIVPTSTGAAKAVALVLPSLKGKLNGIALRVPTPNVSVVDLVVQVTKKTFAEEVNAAFRDSSAKELAGILSVCDEPLVSVDFRCTDVSSTVDSSLTMVMGDDMVKVIAWYDNEWGYSQRVVDLADIVANNWK
ncbi:unnamed protein product [Prunus brigantina]